MTDIIFDKLIALLGNLWLVIIILSVLPIAEVRLAIPLAIKYGMSPFGAFFLSFASSTVATAILLAAFLPFIRFLSRTKLFKKLATSILNKANRSAEKISCHNATLGDNALSTSSKTAQKTQNNNGDLKKMWGLGLFVAVPLPLTGVYSGSLIAGILELKFIKAFLSITAGNLVAALIVTVASVFFAEYINIMIAVFAITALGAVILLLVKAFGGNKKTATKKSAKKISNKKPAKKPATKN